MQTNFPPLKRQKHGIDLVRKCLHCDAQQIQDDTCRHLDSTCGQQLSMEYQQLQELQAAATDPHFDMNDIERRLRKLETQLTLRLKGEGNTTRDQRQLDINNKNSSPSSSNHLQQEQQEQQQYQRNDPTISLTSTGISITTNLTESHHLFKHLLSGINPTFVREKTAQVYSRCIDFAGPVYDGLNDTQGISNLALDKEDPEEQVWFDMVLATRYAKCFLIYQMVESDHLVEWVSPAYINNLKGQVKLEYSLLSKSVRAFVYSHEKVSNHDALPGDSTHGQQRPNINLNRDVFFFQQAEELLELCYMTSSRNIIRALLHMYMYQVMTPGGYTKAVHYSDLALRMAQALKLNTERGMLVNDQLREDDRRLWWSTVWIHLWSCVALQRPLMVDTADVMIPGSRPPSKRQNESNQVGYCIDLCVHCVKLLLLSRSIRQRLESKTTEAKLLQNLADMEHQLDAWSIALPEALQPRFWNNDNGNVSSNTLLDHMNDSGHHEHDHTLSTQESAMEIGLMLQGLWVLTKTQLYECYETNDGSVLDLLVVRNRLQVAMDYTNHLAQAIHRIRPCVSVIMVTLIGCSLSTLLTMVTYPHNPEVVEQAARHLLGLKTLLQMRPFIDDCTAQKWVFDIDQSLAQRGPQLHGSALDMARNTKGSTTMVNETVSTQLQGFQHQQQQQHHQYPTDLNHSTGKTDSNRYNNGNMHPLNVGPILFSPPASSPTAMAHSREMQQYQVYGSSQIGKAALMNGIDLYRFYPSGMQQTQLQHLSHNEYTQRGINSGVSAAAPSSSFIPPYHSTNNPMSAFEGQQTRAWTPPPPSAHGNHYGLYQQQQQQHQQLQWSVSREQDHLSLGKQSSELPPYHLSPPLPPRLDPDQHPSLPYPSTDQQ